MIRYTVMALVGLDIIFNVIGQLFLKHGMNKLGNFKFPWMLCYRFSSSF
jgi:hypothetical protein